MENESNTNAKPVMWKVWIWTILSFFLGNWICGLVLTLVCVILLGETELPQLFWLLLGILRFAVALTVAIIAYKRSKARGGKAPWKSFTLQK